MWKKGLHCIKVGFYIVYYWCFYAWHISKHLPRMQSSGAIFFSALSIIGQKKLLETLLLFFLGLYFSWFKRIVLESAKTLFTHLWSYCYFLFDSVRYKSGFGFSLSSPTPMTNTEINPTALSPNFCDEFLVLVSSSITFFFHNKSFAHMLAIASTHVAKRLCNH